MPDSMECGAPDSRWNMEWPTVWSVKHGMPDSVECGTWHVCMEYALPDSVECWLAIHIKNKKMCMLLK